MCTHDDVACPKVTFHNIAQVTASYRVSAVNWKGVGINACHFRAMLLYLRILHATTIFLRCLAGQENVKQCCGCRVSISGTGAEAGAYTELFIHHIPWRVDNCVGQTILAYG